MADDATFQPREFKPLPSGPSSSSRPVRQFQRHRILSDEQFGKVTVPEPQRSFIGGEGEAWQGR
jgi:hypothetical protein